MSQAIPLPPRPNLAQYKKLAKELQHACNSSDPSAICDWAVHLLEAIARLQGSKLSPAVRKELALEAERFEQRWLKFRKKKEPAARCTLTDTQFFIAREHRLRELAKICQAPRSNCGCFTGLGV